MNAGADSGGWDCHVHVFDGRPSPGHYQAPPRRLAMLEEAAQGLGVDRFVLVQPSVYGSDNSLLLETLRAAEPRHRGVVVLDAAVRDGELDAMHDAGVRGARFNLVSPLGNAAGALDSLAPRLRERGWHVQWYAGTAQLGQIATLQRRHGFTAVLDHLAGMTPQGSHDVQAWDSLRMLADAGAWIKLSGWYRLASAPPYQDMEASIARVSSLFGDRCVWGSDWPHTSFMDADAGLPPAYADLWRPVIGALAPSRAAAVLRQQPWALYR